MYVGAVVETKANSTAVTVTGFENAAKVAMVKTEDKDGRFAVMKIGDLQQMPGANSRKYTMIPSESNWIPHIQTGDVVTLNDQADASFRYLVCKTPWNAGNDKNPEFKVTLKSINNDWIRNAGMESMSSKDWAAFAEGQVGDNTFNETVNTVQKLVLSNFGRVAVDGGQSFFEAPEEEDDGNNSNEDWVSNL